MNERQSVEKYPELTIAIANVQKDKPTTNTCETD